VPLRIAIDGTPLIGERTGIGHVTTNLLTALADRSDVDVVAYAISRTARRDLAPQLPSGVGVGTSPLPARLVLPLWERWPVPRIEHWTGRVDVVHATNYSAPPARAPVVVTVHDLTFVHRPDLVSDDTRRFFDGLVRAALARGATVHVVSDYVGEETRQVFGLPPERVVRVYPGLADTAGGDATRGRRLAGTDAYVLALGQLEPRKNLPVLVQAFARLSVSHRDLHLVVAGPDGWGRTEFEAAARAAGSERIRWLGYVPDHDRRDLLAGARVFAYPSLYEGFGHPPLEAMLADVPVVAAASGAIPEIVGDAAELVDPADVEGLADALARTADDDGLRSRLVTAGRARAARFGWPRAAQGFVDLYTRLAEAR
jgi:glycosyltransferase involved in cell wall biosynthesis